jgi:hypothetical protein
LASKQDKAKKYYEWYTQSRDDTRDWREQRDRCKKAYLGNQWDTQVAQRLRDRGQIDVVINILRTLIRNRVSTMIANKPTGRILGVSKDDIVDAQVLQDFMDWHWYNSTGQLRAERVVMSQQREGVGYFIVALDPKADYGRGELKIYDENWRHVYVPKSAGREWDLADAPYVQVSKLLSEEEFYMQNPGFRGKITPDYLQADDEIRWSGQREHQESDDIDLPEGIIDVNFIREIDTYERFYRDNRVLYYVPTGTVELIDDNYTPNDNENDLIQQGLLKEVVAPVPRIRYTKTYGEKVYRYTEILPIDHYPVVSVPDEDTGNAMPLGEIDQTFGVQELLNKFFSIVVLNAALTSNPKFLADAARAGITDLEKFREGWAAPGGWHNMKMDPQTGRFPFEIVRPDPLNPAFYPLFERMIGVLQFGMATFSSKLGDTANSPETYSATLQYGEWQQDNLRIPLSRLEMGLQRVFDIILQWSPKHYTFHKMFDIVKDNEVVGQGAINEPRMNQQGELEILNNIEKIRAKFRIRMGSTMPSQTVAFMNLYKELAATNPLFMKYLVEYLPVKEKDQLVKELDLVQQMSGQLEQKNQELNTISGMLQNALRQQAEGEIRKDVEQTAIQLDKIIAEQQIVLKEMKSEQKMAKQKNQLAKSNNKESKK